MALSKEEMLTVIVMCIGGLGLIIPFIIQYVTRDSRSSSGKSIHKFFNGVFWFFFLLAAFPFSTIAFALAGDTLARKGWIDYSVAEGMKKFGIALLFIMFFPFSLIVYIIYKASEHGFFGSSSSGSYSSNNGYSGSVSSGSSGTYSTGGKQQYHCADGTVITVYPDGRAIDNKGNTGCVVKDGCVQFNSGEINYFDAGDIRDSNYNWRGKQ